MQNSNSRTKNGVKSYAPAMAANRKLEPTALSQPVKAMTFVRNGGVKLMNSTATHTDLTVPGFGFSGDRFKNTKLKTMLITVGSALCLALLAGCAEEDGEVTANVKVTVSESENIVRDVAYYMTNENARQSMKEQCMNNPGLFRTDPDCINAREADRQVRLQAQIDKLD